MATEAGRHQLYERISTEWGQEHAEELMSYLPPVGWADVATKQDLKLLSAELRAEVRGEIGALAKQWHDESRTKLFWLVGSMLAIQAASIGAFAAIVSWIG